MQIEVVKSKIHRAIVTQADLNYIGSITIDEDEPDEPTEYALVSAEGFYDTLRDAL